MCELEYRDDSQIIPRSSSVIVKRLPASRPGKGKAAMYIGTAGAVAQSSEPLQRPGGPSNAAVWHKGAISKRFDGKDEFSSSKTAPTVRRSPLRSWLLLKGHSRFPLSSHPLQRRTKRLLWQRCSKPR